MPTFRIIEEKAFLENWKKNQMNAFQRNFRNIEHMQSVSLNVSIKIVKNLMNVQTTILIADFWELFLWVYTLYISYFFS